MSFLQSFVNTHKTVTPSTHTSLAGGCYHVPSEGYRDNFLSKYLNAFRAGGKLFLTERVPKGAPFRWFADLDYPFSDVVRGWSPQQFRQFYKINHQAVLAALDSLELSHLSQRVRLSVRASKIHLHVPGLVVHAECARAFLKVVRTFIEADPVKSELLAILGTVNFDTVFDASVYSSGLRMLGSHKGKDKDPDWVHQKFYQMIDEDCELIDLTLDDEPDVLLDVLEDACIFNLQNLPVTNFARDLDTFVKNQAPVASDAPPSGTHVIDPSQVDTLKAGIQLVLCFRPEEIQSIKKYSTSMVVEVNSTYCHGLKREHSSNRAYLVVSSSMVTQKCHAPLCKDNVDAMIRTPIEKFPVEFRNLVQALLNVTTTVTCITSENPMFHKLATEVKQDFSVLTRLKKPVVQSIESVDGHLAVTIQPGKLSPNALFMDSDAAHVNWLRHVKSCGEASELCLHSRNGNYISIDCLSAVCPFRIPEIPNSYIERSQPVTKQYLTQLNQFNFQGAIINVNGAPANESNMRIDLPVNADLIFPGNPLLGTLFVNALHRGTATHVGKFAYEMGKDLFGVNSSPKSFDEWWAFMGRSGRWVERKQNVQAFFQDDVPRKIAEGHIAVSRQIVDSTLSKRLTQRVDFIIKSLEDVQHLNFMAEAAIQFKVHDPNFVSRFNQKQHLISFQNGVFDLLTGSFRDGEPSDMLTVGLSYNYPDAVDLVIRAEILNFFEEIQPDPAQRKYLLCFLGSMLMGGGGKQHFHIFTGQGRNGKSVLSEILKVTLELDFFKSPPPTFLMNERPGSDKPCPDLISLRYARAVIVSEPGESKIKSGFMKALTGQDSMEVRNLHESAMVSIKPA
ncbi:hypothetical protein BJ741DRAFT_628304 [Chytriomyces cf. hyalinus JEL632]|nr:hypothetical protein BJ741DRAFT_628304 [Chytriomyces cf. hyalinus JEL632]